MDPNDVIMSQLRMTTRLETALAQTEAELQQALAANAELAKERDAALEALKNREQRRAAAKAK